MERGREGREERKKILRRRLIIVLDDIADTCETLERATYTILEKGATKVPPPSPALLFSPSLISTSLHALLSSRLFVLFIPSFPSLQVYALVTHGVLSDGAIERIIAMPLTELVITNSIPNDYNLSQCSKVHPSLSPLSLLRLSFMSSTIYLTLC